MELKAGDHRKAKWSIRHYREIEEYVHKIERKRPRLVSLLVCEPETGLPLLSEQQPLMKGSADGKIITTYVEGRAVIDIVSTVIDERLKPRDSEIMRDVCLRGISVKDAVDLHGVSESTVKRARLRMEKAYSDEVAARTVRN